jgi:hypothetical protein
LNFSSWISALAGWFVSRQVSICADLQSWKFSEHGCIEWRVVAGARWSFQRDIAALVGGELAAARGERDGRVGGAQRAEGKRRKPLVAAVLPPMEQSSGELRSSIDSRNRRGDKHRLINRSRARVSPSTSTKFLKLRRPTIFEIAFPTPISAALALKEFFLLCYDLSQNCSCLAQNNWEKRSPRRDFFLEMKSEEARQQEAKKVAFESLTNRSREPTWLFSKNKRNKKPQEERSAEAEQEVSE